MDNTEFNTFNFYTRELSFNLSEDMTLNKDLENELSKLERSNTNPLFKSEELLLSQEDFKDQNFEEITLNNSFNLEQSPVCAINFDEPSMKQDVPCLSLEATSHSKENISERKEKQALQWKENGRLNVIKKSSVRMIKRFYHRLFLRDNKTLVKKRFVNSKASLILQAAMKFTKKYLKIDSESFAVYLLKVIGVKYTHSDSSHEEAIKEADDYKMLLSNFSNPRFDQIQESKYFQILVEYIMKGSLPDSKKSCYQHLLETEKKYIEKNPKNYSDVFQILNNQ
ncbi:unnamed protein product [Moneuplotes crassus]|uniref:Uncharacterized protein n=1 Tax=Euplotes crassus TaxID=5936 RepID=A0AAD1XU04_EUPCR|nr:unnamed protein product [Moneuplotes crassus]